MPLQDLYIGLGSLAYAVAKSDGYLSEKEKEHLETILQNEEHGPIALFAFQLKHSSNARLEEAYQFAFRRFVANQPELKPELREHFFSVLQEIARCCNGVSPEEHALLKRIRRDLGKLSHKNKSMSLAGKP
jgi:uncharacterized tellurite resistance protein B-like protein